MLKLTFLFVLVSCQNAIVSCPNNLPHKPSDALLYFSYDGKNDSRLTRVSKQRLDFLASLYHKGQKVFVNGHGKADPNTALMAKDYLEQMGIEDIYLEEKSTNTWENLKFALLQFKEIGVRSVTFVSSPYHIDRILRYYQKQTKPEEFDVYWGSYPDKLDDVESLNKYAQILHEYIAVMRDYFFYNGRLTSGFCFRESL